MFIRWLATAPLLIACACSAPVERTEVYDARFGDATAMDIFLPSDELDVARPAVMLVHGGAWKFMHKEQYRSLGRRLARAGYVAASVEYRLVPEGVFPNAAQDVGCALSYLRNHAAELGLDPNRIAAMGYSAGGHLVSLLAVSENVPMIAPDCAEGPTYPPAAIISGAGPQDLFALSGAKIVREFLGGSPDEIEDVYFAASPIFNVHPDMPPFLFIHGSTDFVVPTGQSERMRDAVEAQGVEAQLLLVRGAGHVLEANGEWGDVDVQASTESPESWIAISAFLERTVGTP
jgi:acetyl esterase/lipase